MKQYISPSTMDSSNTTTTCIFTLLLVFVMLLTAKNNYFVAMFLALSFAVLYTYIYTNLPTKLILTSDSLILDAPYNKKAIHYKDITSFQLLSKEESRSLIRTFGASGIFGHIGHFLSSQTGAVFVYARRNNNWILITTINNKKYVIAPDDPLFIEHMKNII